jgi:hypothetical protein
MLDNLYPFLKEACSLFCYVLPMCFHDMALNIQLYNQLVLVLLVIIFLFEWRRAGAASEMYAFITGLFISKLWVNQFHIYARWLNIHDDTRFNAFLDTFMWKARYIPVGVFLTAILVIVVIRIGARRKLDIKKIKPELRKERRRHEAL